jgi:vancomycin resistance protein YoaR
MRIGNYFQEYSPIRRRRSGKTAMPDDDQQHERPSLSRARAFDDEHEIRRPQRARTQQRDTISDQARAQRRAVTTERLRRRRHELRRRKRRPFPLKQVLLTSAVLAVVVLLTLPYSVSFFFHGRALPGVSVQGMPVGELDQHAIDATLQARHREFLRQPVTLHFDGQTWQPSLEELGVSFDITQASTTAVQTGREGGLVSRLQNQWQLWQQGLDIAPNLVIDREQMQGYLLNIANDVEQAPRDARLNIARANIMSVPARPGRQLLIDESANDIMLALRTLSPQEVTLRTRLLEPVAGNEAALAAEEQAREMVGSPLVLTHGEQRWVWTAEHLADLLNVRHEDSDIQVEIDQEQLVAEIEQLAMEIDSGSVEPRLRFDGSNLYIVRDGRVGWQLRQDDAMRVISDTLRQSKTTTRTVSLPIDELNPQVTAERLPSLGIHELLGEGRSSFAGSAPYRVTNIKAGAERMDGVLIAPGEEFSFNTQLGEVTAENGFVEGYAVVGSRTVLEWGGGVCQNSTTVFRAAFWSGMPITERHAHPFYISWYDQYGFGPAGNGAGMDATIYTGVNDLKFVNDTGAWVLMQVAVDEANQVLTVQLYGTNPDSRRVEFDGPYVSNIVNAPSTPVYIDDPSKPSGYVSQTDAARNGRDITVYRIIYENGVEVSREPFHTHFRAWPNVYVRGTG